MTGWPDPKRPGVPLNPERYGWHWLQWTPNVGAPCYWTGEKWLDEEWGMRAATCRYLGPCLTPTEVAALVEQARREGAEAMREACAAIVRTHAAAARKCSEEADVIHRIRAEYLTKAFALNAAADDILATLPLPGDET